VVTVEARAARSPVHALTDGDTGGLGAQADATSTLGLLRCPACGLRPRTAVPGSVARVVLYTLGGMLVFYMAARVALGRAFLFRLPDWTTPAIVLTFGLTALGIELRRWRAAARAAFTKVRPARGTDLPVAVARVAPPLPAEPVASPAPVVAAPPKIEPATDAPRFLTDRSRD
jgi:hypothetical protein